MGSALVLYLGCQSFAILLPICILHSFILFDYRPPFPHSAFFVSVCVPFVILVFALLLVSGLSSAACMTAIPFLRSLLKSMLFLPYAYYVVVFCLFL